MSVFGHTDIISGKMHLEGQGEILHKLIFQTPIKN